MNPDPPQVSEGAVEAARRSLPPLFDQGGGEIDKHEIADACVRAAAPHLRPEREGMTFYVHPGKEAEAAELMRIAADNLDPSRPERGDEELREALEELAHDPGAGQRFSGRRFQRIALAALNKNTEEGSE